MDTKMEKYSFNCDKCGIAGDFAPGQIGKCPSCGEELAMQDGVPGIRIVYTNWKAQTEIRVIKPLESFYGHNEWHQVPQWLLRAWDVEKGAERTFAWRDIRCILG